MTVVHQNTIEQSGRTFTNTTEQRSGPFPDGRPLEIRYRSGTVVLKNVKEIANFLEQMLEDAIIRTLQDFESEFISTLAFETGRFRSLVKLVTRGMVTPQLGQGKVIIDLNSLIRKLISGLDYARYHIDGRPYHPGSMVYRNPTVQGTEPFQTEEFTDFFFRKGRLNAKMIRDMTGVIVKEVGPSVGKQIASELS